MLHTQDTNLEPIGSIIPRTLACVRSPGIFIGENTGAAVPVKCKQWQCPHCGRVLRAKFLNRARSIRPNYLLTFTTGQELTAETSKQLNAAVREFRRLFRKYIGPIVDWAWANEDNTENQCLHKHMLIEAPSVNFIDYRNGTRDLNTNFHRLCERAGIAGIWNHVAKIENVDEHFAANYLAKYLVKESTKPYPRYVRRCMTSVPKGGKPWVSNQALKARMQTCSLTVFEPVSFVANREIDPAHMSEDVDSETGEVFQQYRGPSYISPNVSPRYRQTRERFISLAPMNKDGGGHGVSECEAPIAPLTASSLNILVPRRDSVEGKETVL